MIQGLLLEGGIPSVLKRAGGFDAPEFMAAGPHDVWSTQPRPEARKTCSPTR